MPGTRVGSPNRSPSRKSSERLTATDLSHHLPTESQVHWLDSYTPKFTCTVVRTVDDLKKEMTVNFSPFRLTFVSYNVDT